MKELNVELANVARSIARLLVAPTHDKAELARLDRRAAELRARIREAQLAQEAARPVELRSLESPARYLSGA